MDGKFPAFLLKDTFGMSCEQVYKSVYMEGEGLRVLKGLCDELFKIISEKEAFTIEMTEEGRWMFGWSRFVKGLGYVMFNWRAPEDGGRGWLKRKDEEFKREYEHMVNSSLIFSTDKENKLVVKNERFNMVAGEKLGVKSEKLDRALKDITLEEVCVMNQMGRVEMLDEDERSESSESMSEDGGDFDIVEDHVCELCVLDGLYGKCCVCGLYGKWCVCRLEGM